MKKRTYLFLSILIICVMTTLVNSRSSFASIKTSDGTTWYSAKEMSAVIEKEMNNIRLYCEETDYDCWRQIYEVRASSDLRFFITDFFAAKMFVPTIINHEEGTITSVFHNGSFLEHGYADMTGYSIDEIYLAWFDYPTYGVFVDLQRFKNSEEVDGMHQLYKQYNYEQPIPLFIDYEMPLADHLPDDYMINFHVVGGNFTATGTYDYSHCVNSPSYVPGMECRFMMSEDMGSDYFPFWPGDESDTDLGFLNEDDGIDYEQLLYRPDSFSDLLPNEPISNPTEPISYSEETTSGSANSDLESNLTPLDLGSFDQKEISVPSAPNTGLSEGPVCEKTIEFPWWITLLVAMGEVLVLWWFVPTRKNMKNLKKRS